jgi:hypothetical protein
MDSLIDAELPEKTNEYILVINDDKNVKIEIPN